MRTQRVLRMPYVPNPIRCRLRLCRFFSKGKLNKPCYTGSLVARDITQVHSVQTGLALQRVASLEGELQELKEDFQNFL